MRAEGWRLKNERQIFDSWFAIWGFEFSPMGLMLGARGLETRFRVRGSWFRVQGSGFRVQGSGLGFLALDDAFFAEFETCLHSPHLLPDLSHGV